VCHSIVLSDQVDGPGDHSASTLVPMPGWTGAPQIVPARIVWRTELGQQLPGERKARRRAGEAAERGDLDGRGRCPAGSSGVLTCSLMTRTWPAGSGPAAGSPSTSAGPRLTCGCPRWCVPHNTMRVLPTFPRCGPVRKTARPLRAQSGRVPVPPPLNAFSPASHNAPGEWVVSAPGASSSGESLAVPGGIGALML
jgi:hypothetical protein